MTAPTITASGLRHLGRFFLLWHRSWAAEHRSPLRGLKSRLVFVGVLSLGALVFSLTAIFLGPTLRRSAPTPVWITEPLDLPDLGPKVAAVLSFGDFTASWSRIEPGDTLLSVFARIGLRDADALAFIRRTPETRPLAMPQPGQFLSAGVYEDGRLAFLKLFMEGPLTDDDRMVELVREGEIFRAAVLPYTFETQAVLASGACQGSLSATARALGLPDTVARQLPEVWEGAANPLTHMKKGDTLRVIFERRYADGNFVRDDGILAVQVVRGEKVDEAFWYTAPTGSEGFYTLEGRSASQTFMRVPLDVKDVTSEFAALRRHPITGVLRAHNGTDMRAPTGARVFAAADGVVDRVAYQPRGYGNYIRISHGLGRVTVYAHLSKVARGLKAGQSVTKGQVIGFVGMTGLATGPHLHYELLINGVQVNPKTADIPDQENLTSFQLAQLRAQAAPLLARFERAAQQEGAPSPAELKLREEEARAPRTEEAEPGDEALPLDEGGDESMLESPAG